jgi:hypothetical protein
MAPRPCSPGAHHAHQSLDENSPANQIYEVLSTLMWDADMAGRHTTWQRMDGEHENVGGGGWGRGVTLNLNPKP